MRHSYILRHLLLARIYLITVILTNASAQDVSFTGFGAVGFRSINRNPVALFNQEPYYEGKLQVDLDLSKQIDAQLDFRGKSQDKQLVLREFSVKFKYLRLARIKVGNIKKPFSLEGLTDRDEYIPVNDSHIHRRVSELGYDGRNIGVLVYYNYSKKRPQYPFSYALGAFRNSSYVTSIYGRAAAQLRSNYTVAFGYGHLSRGGDDAIETHGASIDVGYCSDHWESNIEAIYVQDPEEGIRRRLQGSSDRVYSSGIKSFSAIRIDIGSLVVKSIEPYMLFGVFSPDLSNTTWHTLQVMLGVNVFLDDNVRLRLSADGLYSKDRHAVEYSSHGSMFIAEIFVRY